MNIEIFNKETVQALKKIDIQLNKKQVEKLYKYMNLLLEWNEKINLTSITEPKDIILKHFVDSLTVLQYINDNEKIIDVGTGAGFPGIPLAIAKENAYITLLDSLNKRINFLNEISNDLDISNVTAIHGRAEEIGNMKQHREKYDIAVSRAVAPINILLEYLIPLVRVGGKCICMKGPNYKDEIKSIDNALKILGGKICEIKQIDINQEMQRNIIIVEKVEHTNRTYPRKAGIPSKKPL